MRKWDIAKLLIEGCNSPEEANETAGVLRDRGSMAQIISILEGFSDLRVASVASETTVKNAQRDLSPTPSKREEKLTKSQADSSGEFSGPNSQMTLIEQLELIFRSKGMTNKEIEEWIRLNFNITFVVGKESLRIYLTKVLNRASLGQRNRILAAAQRLIKKGSKVNSEIREYWDELDKRQFLNQ